jgi:TonB family protein
VSREVDHILHERSRRSRGAPRKAELAAVAGALVLHLLFVAVAFALPRLKPAPEPLEFVPVQIIPAQALGVRRPAPPRRKNPAPTPETAAEEPEAKPEPQKPAAPDDVPVLPSPDDSKKKPAATPAPTATPTSPDKARPDKARQETGRSSESSEGPAGTAPGETGDQLGRRGGPRGNPLGTTAFGSELAGVDNPDFTYGYYLDRLLSLIDAQWARPSMGTGIKTVIFFRINRDGSMTDLRVAESSGYNSFDLAALRAVQNAAPFPPLPRAFQHDSLGVNLIVR